MSGVVRPMSAMGPNPSRKGVVPIEPVLRASSRFFGRHKGGFICDGVLLVLLPAPQ